MYTALWLILGGLGVAAASLLFKKRRLPQLPDIPDEEFLKLYETSPSERMRVLEGRRFIAKHLGLPAHKLSPEQKFEWLAQFTGFAAEYEVGMGDLEDELIELRTRAGLKAPSPFPATVGELVHEIVEARRSLKHK